VSPMIKTALASNPFADENGKMMTHEGSLKEKELNMIFERN